MALDIFFHEGISDRLTALAQANDRALALALRYGMDAEAAELCRAVYAGALGDVARAFGLVLAIPKREEVIDNAIETIPEMGNYADRPALSGHGYLMASDAGCAANGHLGPGVGDGERPKHK
jgi:hypothetical protein